jgi:hypothetical protein
MTVPLSAAHTRATASQASAAPHSHRYAGHREPPCVAPFPRVEFIYTPDNRRIDFTFNDLCAAYRCQPQPFHHKYVDDLDSSLPQPCCAASLRAFLRPTAYVKTSHNGHCVTLEPRPRYNMSHRRPSRAGWHACCLYNKQEGRSCPREGSKQAGSILIKRGSGMRLESPSDTSQCRTKIKTLLHTQAGDK